MHGQQNIKNDWRYSVCVKTYAKVERAFNMVKPAVMKTPRNVQ